MALLNSLEVVKRGLFYNQKAMDITGNNIANANTAGYTRQRVVAGSEIPNYINKTLSVKNAVSSGLKVEEVQQIRDRFLDIRYRDEDSLMNEYESKMNFLSAIEDAINEPSDSGILNALSGFFTAIDEMSKSPESMEMRVLVRQEAIRLTETIKGTYTRLSQIQINMDEETGIIVKEINRIADNISNMNNLIQKLESSGYKALDLRDKRNLLVDELSEYIGIKTVEDSNGVLSIKVGDEYLINGADVNHLEVSLSKSNPISGESMLNEISWKDGDAEFKATGGRLKAVLDMRDGEGQNIHLGNDSKGIPWVINSLNNFTRGLAQSINNIHKEGFTIPNDSNSYISETGKDFFDDGSGVASQISAKNISLTVEIKTNSFNIASSDTSVSNITKGNGGNALKMAEVYLNDNIVISVGGSNKNIGSIGGYFRELITENALDVSYAKSIYENQLIVKDNIENLRQSVSGVSLDEELTNMLKYQHAYNAAAKMINAIDKAFEALLSIL